MKSIMHGMMFGVCLLFAVGAAAGIDDGLRAYYPFSGNAEDAGPGGHDAIEHSMQYTGDAWGNANSSALLRENGWLDCGDSADFRPVGAVTLHLLIFVPTRWSTTGWMTLAGNTESGGYELYISGRENRVYGKLRRNGAYGEVSGSLDPYVGQWIQVALTYDGRVLRLYCIGEEVDLDDAGADYAIQYAHANHFLIGAEASAGADPEPGWYFTYGQVDEVRVYDRALSREELQQLAPPFQADPEVIAYYPFTEHPYDISGQQRHGTLHGPLLVPDVYGDPLRAYEFDGLNDYIDLSQNAAFRPVDGLSVNLWASRDDWGDVAGREVLIGNAAAGGWELALEHGRFVGRVFRNGSFAELSMNISGQAPGWHRFGMTYDGRSTVLYFDEGAVATDDAGGEYPIEYAHMNNTLIGAGASTGFFPSGDHFEGRIDEVRLFSRALSEDEMPWVPPANPADGLIAYYPFNGDADNEVRDANHGENHGAFLWHDRFGNPNSAYYFGTDYIECGDSIDLRPPAAVSLHVWGRRNDWSSGSGYMTLAGNTHVGGYGIWLYGYEGYLYGDVRRNGGAGRPQIRLSALAPGWHQFVVTYDGRTTRLYVDGEHVDDDDAGGTYPIDYTYENSFIIGAEASAYSWPEGDYFEGFLDEVRVYNRCLSPGEIRALYYSDRPVPIEITSFARDAGQVRLTWEIVPNVSTFGVYTSGDLSIDPSAWQAAVENLTEPAWSLPVAGTTRFYRVGAEMQLPTEDLASDLRLYYPLDDGSGQATVGANHGTVVGAIPGPNRRGETDRACVFDGDGDAIDLSSPFPFGNGPVSIDAWVKVPAGGGGAVLGNRGDAPNADWGVDSSGRIRFRWNDGQVDVAGTTDLRDGAWHHLAWVRDPVTGSSTVYVDGAAEGSGGAGANIVFSTAHRIGANRETTPDWFLGSIDDLRIYYRALSAEAIRQLYIFGR